MLLPQKWAPPTRVYLEHPLSENPKNSRPQATWIIGRSNQTPPPADLSSAIGCWKTTLHRDQCPRRRAGRRRCQGYNNVRTQSLCAHWLAVLPRASRSCGPAPALSRTSMISFWRPFDSGDPVPPLPVFCTARCKGVDPLLFLSRTSAPMRSSESTALEHR